MKRLTVLIAICILFVSAFNFSSKIGQEHNPEPDQNTRAISENRCGDNVCDGPETANNCPQDCTLRETTSGESANMEEQEIIPIDSN